MSAWDKLSPKAHVSFLRQNQERVHATRDFCFALQSIPDPVSAELLKVQDPVDRLGWCIFSAAIHQGIPLANVALVLAELMPEFPQRSCWALPVPKEKQVLATLARLHWTQGWSLLEHIPGILLGVGQWMRQAGEDPLAYVQKQTSAQLWSSFASIYFMGKSSVIRPKALELLMRLRMQSPLGMGLHIEDAPLRSGECWPLPISMGARRWLRSFGPDPRRWMEAHSEVERLRYFQKMFQGLSKENPEIIAHGLSFFLEADGTELLCRKALQGCYHCPLAALSPLSPSCPRRTV